MHREMAHEHFILVHEEIPAFIIGIMQLSLQAEIPPPNKRFVLVMGYHS